jgi:hypothetical protein
MMKDKTLTLSEAAQLLAAPGSDPHAAEVLLAEAIESGRLHASVKRWATEQWEGRLLPGNINRRETCIEPADLQAWQAGRQG